MNETEFKRKLKEKLEKRLQNDYTLKENENLIYKIIVDKNFGYKPIDPKNPKRGDFAFQADLVIVKRESNLPLVVIETKYGGFSTHDVLTYSTKALKHKEIYPYIRYGLVVVEKDKIDNKFFIHNVGFDFAVAIEKIDEANLQRLNAIIQKTIRKCKTIFGYFCW